MILADSEDGGAAPDVVVLNLPELLSRRVPLPLNWALKSQSSPIHLHPDAFEGALIASEVLTADANLRVDGEQRRQGALAASPPPDITREGRRRCGGDLVSYGGAGPSILDADSLLLGHLWGSDRHLDCWFVSLGRLVSCSRFRESAPGMEGTASAGMWAGARPNPPHTG